ncbi:MAG: hypothetical protein AAB327_03325 [Actinomycetota bacterium]
MKNIWDTVPARNSMELRHTQRWRTIIVVYSLFLLGFGAGAATPVSAQPVAVDLRLTAQNFNISQSSSLRLVVRIDNDLVRTAVIGDRSSLFRISAGRQVTTRLDVTDIGNGSTLVKQVAHLDIPVSRTPQSAGGNFTLIVPTTTSVRRDALSIGPSGIFPITVQIILNKDLVGQLTTFINVFDPGVPYPKMPVSIAVSVTSPPTLQPNGRTVVSDGSRTQLKRLADLLEVNAAPFSVQVQPELLDGLARSNATGDGDLLARLRRRFQFHNLLSTTYVSFDPSSAQRGSMTSEFVDQLRRGEDIIDINNGDAVPSRTTWLSRTTVDADGASLLRDFGVHSLVLLPQAAAPLGTLDNYARAYRIVSPSQGTSNAVALFISDPTYAQELSGTHENPVLDAYRIAAELLAERTEIIRANGDPTTRLTVLSTNTGDVQDPTIMGRLAIALDHAPQLVLQALSDARAIGDDATSIDLPRTTRVDVVATRDALATLLNEIRSTSTMLSAESPQPAAWSLLVAAASCDTLSSDEFDRYVVGIRSQLRNVRTSIKVPESLTFTLTGRESNLRLQLRNTASQPLSVIVELVSAKLQFPTGSQSVTIPADSTFDLVVPVVARANWTFPIEVVLHTPDGTTQVGRRIQFSARVSALAGLGQLVTGAAVLILIAWWAAHVRRKRREDSKGKHPAVR